MAKDYRTMVKKLLALAGSSNENEAKAALLKARQMMAEHKLSERECIDAEKAVVRKEKTGITCTKRKDAWIASLAATIAENYCCKSYRVHKAGCQTNEIGFIGLEEDFEICVEVFHYAVDSVRSMEKELRKTYKGMLRPEEVTRVCNSYGEGFVSGVSKMYEEQSAEHSDWGLVMSVPTEVEEATSGMGAGKSFSSRPTNQSIYAVAASLRGEEDGKQFNPEKRLETA